MIIFRLVFVNRLFILSHLVGWKCQHRCSIVYFAARFTIMHCSTFFSFSNLSCGTPRAISESSKLQWNGTRFTRFFLLCVQSQRRKPKEIGRVQEKKHINSIECKQNRGKKHTPNKNPHLLIVAARVHIVFSRLFISFDSLHRPWFCWWCGCCCARDCLHFLNVFIASLFYLFA